MFYVSDSICKPEQESLVAKGASVQEITGIIGSVAQSQEELGGAVQSVNENLQEITYNSEVVSEEVGNVLTSIETLQKTMEGFQV